MRAVIINDNICFFAFLFQKIAFVKFVDKFIKFRPYSCAFFMVQKAKFNFAIEGKSGSFICFI